jgi:hypothetical protein
LTGSAEPGRECQNRAVASSNTRLKLTATRTLNSGIVMLSYQAPDTERPSASG